jgi:hypothetical protein
MFNHQAALYAFSRPLATRKLPFPPEPVEFGGGPKLPSITYNEVNCELLVIANYRKPLTAGARCDRPRMNLAISSWQSRRADKPDEPELEPSDCIPSGVR